MTDQAKPERMPLSLHYPTSECMKVIAIRYCIFELLPGFCVFWLPILT